MHVVLTLHFMVLTGSSSGPTASMPAKRMVGGLLALDGHCIRPGLLDRWLWVGPRVRLAYHFTPKAWVDEALASGSFRYAPGPVLGLGLGLMGMCYVLMKLWLGARPGPSSTSSSDGSTTMTGSDPTPPILDPDGLLDGDEARAREIVLAGDGMDLGPYPPGTFRQIGRGIVTLVALIVATYVVPGLDWARPWTPDDPVPFWNLVGRELLGEGDEDDAGSEQLEAARAIAAEQETVDAAPIADRTVVAADADGVPPPYRPHPDDAEAVPQALELPDPGALDPFFAQLTRTEAGYAGAVTRVSHWGTR